jgi:CheY-like chemotaxis protein
MTSSNIGGTGQVEKNMTSAHDSPPGGRGGIITVVDRPPIAFLADDDADFREVARQLLREDGYAVTEAADGVEALELLLAMADAALPLPEVLILEFVMPRLSGLGVLRALRRLGRLPPALLLTVFLDPSVDTVANRLGVYRVLRKPVDSFTLLAAVSEAVPRARVGSARIHLDA